MAERIKVGDMVEFIKGGGQVAGRQAQVKKVYDWTPTVRVLIIPEMHQFVTNISNVRKV